MIRRTGQQGVPVVTAGDDVVLGYDEVGLGRIARRFAGPKRPPLGLMAADAESYLSRHKDVATKFPEGTRGVFVGEVKPDSVAEKSGVRPGDVIQAVANKRIRRMSDLDVIVDTLKAGESVSMRFLRDGEEHNAVLQF
jgi:S1-C subfamily serine protease